MADELQVADKKEYEMSFLLIGEDGASEITNALSAIGADITTKSPLNSIKLAYPIKKHQSAFFGFVIFSALPSAVKGMRDSLALNPKILRSLVITPPVKIASHEPRQSREDRPRKPVATEGEVPRLSPEAKPAEPQILSNEGLEKKLEEILK